ncbi:MAG: AAA family ATPase [Dermatophilaceae bacterium]
MSGARDNEDDTGVDIKRAMAAGFGLDPDAEEAANRQWLRDKDRIEREENYKDHLAVEVDRQRVRHDAAKQLRAEDDQADLATFDDQYLNADQLGNLPTPEPMIAGVLDRHCYAILRGRDGTYKTFIALDWALCLATGKPWQGKAVQRTRVLYIAGEGAYGINARKKAWELAWNTKVEPEWFTLRQSAVNLYKGGPALEDLITRASEGGYGLVVVDTLRRASGGADGNGTDMGVVVDNAVRIIQATLDGSVLALAHTDKGDNDTRGFSGIEDDADIVWHAKRDKDRSPLALTLENVKMKDGPEGLILTLTMAPAAGSLVVSKAADRLTVDEMHDTDQTILTVMRETFALTGATVIQLIEVTELPRSTVYKARGRLLNNGQLISTRRGSSDLLTLARHAVESTVDSDVESTPESTPVSNAVHGTPEHESTPVHTESTPESTPVHAAPPVFRQERVEIPVDETNDTAPKPTTPRAAKAAS